MRSMKPTLRDPAPSRLAYRVNRLALTPMVRRGFVFGLPLFTVLLIAGLALADQGRREAIAGRIAEIRDEFRDREEFLVSAMEIHGASEALEADIRARLSLDFPVSSFDLELNEMQGRVVELDAVKRADLSVRPGGPLELRVVERIAALAWRTETGLRLIDEEGHSTGALERRALRADLPLVSGAGADRAAAEALALLRATDPIADRVRGLARVGERRWDVVLTGGQRIQLPETGARAALDEVLALHETQNVLAREVRLVDLRNPERPTVRLTPEAARTLMQTKMTELGDTGP